MKIAFYLHAQIGGFYLVSIKQNSKTSYFTLVICKTEFVVSNAQDY